MTSRRTHRPSAGFSLVELLMAIFILGIGIISIASLFPAGIAQQRAAVDDQVGPLVARNAISLLRARIPRGTFGHIELDNYGENASQWPGWDIRPGDWPWLRPSLVTSDDHRGAIDIFDTADEVSGLNLDTVGEKNRSTLDDPWVTSALSDRGGIPFRDHLLDPILQEVPVVVIEQADRQYPRSDGSGRAPRYYWDCMFRRTGGKVYAAIFVYRVNSESNAGSWVCQPTSTDQLQTPWLLDLESDNDYEPWRIGQGAGDLIDREQWVLPNADAGDSFDPMEFDDCWQCPGQMMVDQNGVINQVAVGRKRKDDPTTHVELRRPVPPLAEDSLHIPEGSNDEFAIDSGNRVPFTGSLILPGLTASVPGEQAAARDDSDCFYHAGMLVRDMSDGVDQLTGAPVVSRLWYMPSEIEDADGDIWNLTPVYILVEEF